MTLPSGSRVGPYEIVSLLGAGGMGEVYQARDPRLQRDVAIKLVGQRPSATVDRFFREALLASALNHPNVVTVHEIGETEAGRYIVMELVQGRTLRELIREGLTSGRATAIARQVAEALAVAHGAQIVHRDLKPENVMVRADGYVKVLDFGLARGDAPAGAPEVTASSGTDAGSVLGTLAYMSPEQGRGEPATSASDIFSLGIVLYEMFTGGHPFGAPTPMATLHAIVADPPKPYSQDSPDLSPAIQGLVLECLHKDPRLRPTAAEVVQRLQTQAPGAAPLVLGASPEPVRRLVGRSRERDTLDLAYQESARGQGLLIAVAGEPGMGKTMLVEDFLASLENAGGARMARGRCSERLAGSEAYLPFLEALDALLRTETHGGLARVLKSVAPNWYIQLMSLPSDDSSAARTAAEASVGSPQRMKREMAAFLEEASRSGPLVFFLDDVHWADLSTVDLLAYLGDRLRRLPLLMVVTHRPSELARSRHPFLRLKLDLQSRRVCREIVLDMLGEEAVRQYIDLEFPAHAFQREFAPLIHQKTGGHPLFLADLLRELRRGGVVAYNDGRPFLARDLTSVAPEIPQSVRSMIERKIAALAPDERRLLAAASVQGHDFGVSILAQSVELPEADVEDALDRIEREHLFVRSGGEMSYPDGTVTLRYRFTHVLYQNALFTSLGSTRRAILASAVAAALIQRWADRSPEVAHDLAVLFETARAPLMAARYFSLAAQAAARLFAHAEAGALAQRGLALLASLPEDLQRVSLELELQMTRALAVKTTSGYAVPEVGEAYGRARELCGRVQDPGLAIPVLIGLSAHYITAGDIRAANEIARQLLDIANTVGDPHLRMVAEWSLGAALHHFGELPAAHEHLVRALELYDPAFHEARAWEVGIEPGIFCMCETSRTLCLLGLPEQAMARSREAEARARASGHPHSVAFVLLFRMLLCHLLRDPAPARAAHVELVALCEDKGIAQEQRWARAVGGWAMFELGDHDAGLAEIDAGIADQDAIRAELLRPYYLMMRADALARLNRLDEALGALQHAGEIAAATGQFMFEAERHRLHGEMLLARDATQADAAAAAFERARALAGEQQALLFELRAALSHARLLRRAGQADEAPDVLAPVVERLTEGFNSRDVIDALDFLGRESPAVAPSAMAPD